MAILELELRDTQERPGIVGSRVILDKVDILELGHPGTVDSLATQVRVGILERQDILE